MPGRFVAGFREGGEFEGSVEPGAFVEREQIVADVFGEWSRVLRGCKGADSVGTERRDVVAESAGEAGSTGDDRGQIGVLTGDGGDRQSTVKKTLDARRSTLDARRSTLDARRSTLDARRSTLDARTIISGGRRKSG
ncbi:hypothetical protein [Amycolatopsis sp. SID8362]|uniref:hypothetical protein n=1 Tax=Amycolatopsis sp. SID8362 TaxID=2690346 RepID=UPI001370517F|nr:hypothetical protein [Amycolatopsis sp. SID8362]NBH10998.1 hypothetical protein [Amycolatopsis sp. SID8362]